MSNQNQSNNASGGIGFAGLLTILFIALKLMNVITWLWIWVLSPLWINIVLVILLVLVMFGIALKFNK